MESSQLKQKYGLATAIALVVGVVVGSGVFFKAESVLNALSSASYHQPIHEHTPLSCALSDHMYQVAKILYQKTSTHNLFCDAESESTTS